ncbi:MAG: Brp/Blh family beta-carotene 15,15'-dioxygenase [Nostoc sp.]
MNLRTPLIFYLVVSVTLIVSLLSIAFPVFANFYGLFLVGLLVCFVGIPHGATDHLVFYALNKNNNYLINKVKFYFFYVFSILAYTICWYLLPSLTFNIFLTISIYHLGQSNLYYLHLPNKIIKTCIYCCWGLFIITAAVVSNPQEVNYITQYLSSDIWLSDINIRKYFLLLIIIINFLTIGLLFSLKYANKKDLIREYLILSVLGILFYTTPLMISFGIYFSIWHSLGSTFDQIELLRNNTDNLKITDFYLRAIPLSIISIIFLILVALFLNNFNIQELEKNLNATMAAFFIFLAAITFPHTIIRDKLYRKFTSDVESRNS